MIKLSKTDYTNLLKSLKESEKLYKTKKIISTNIKDGIVNMLQGFTNSTALFDFYNYLINNTTKAKNTCSFSNHIGSMALYNIWDVVSDLNLDDRKDNYLLLNLDLHKLWLAIAKQATKSMEQEYTNTVDGLTFTHIFNLYTRDIKSMTYEKKYYWSNVKKYSWDKLCLSPNKDHIAYVDKVNSLGKVVKSHDLPND